MPLASFDYSHVRDHQQENRVFEDGIGHDALRTMDHNDSRKGEDGCAIHEFQKAMKPPTFAIAIITRFIAVPYSHLRDRSAHLTSTNLLIPYCMHSDSLGGANTRNQRGWVGEKS